jgi:hypothetical protein
MYPTFRAKLFLAGAALLAAGHVAFACGSDAWAAKLPGSIYQGVVQGNDLYAVTTQGKLIAVDLAGQSVRDLGSFNLKLTGLLAVTDKAVCVASKDQLHLIDRASGRLIRSLDCGQDVHSFGFLDARRLYVQGDKSFAVLDLPGGKTACAISSMPVGQGLRVRTAALDASGKQLYVLMARPRAGLGVIDLETGKLTDVTPAAVAPGFRIGGQMVVVGDRIYLADCSLSYGVYINHFGYVDLKTRKYHALKVPDHASARGALLPGPGVSVFFSGVDCTYRCDGDGKVTTFRAQVPARASLLAVWEGNAVSVLGNNRLLVAPLGVATTARSK